MRTGKLFKNLCCIGGVIIILLVSSFIGFHYEYTFSDNEVIELARNQGRNEVGLELAYANKQVPKEYYKNYLNAKKRYSKKSNLSNLQNLIEATQQALKRIPQIK